MNKYMEIALKEAKKSLKTDDVPVGAVIVENNKIIAKAHNTKERKQIVTKHAEINAIEKACKKKKNWHLNNCEIYTTMEPCEMCLGAIKAARIKKITFAIPKIKESPLKTPEFEKISENISEKQLIQEFFLKKRK